MLILDCDIASTFAKIDRIGLLKKIKGEIRITKSVYVELMRAKRVGFSFPNKVLDIPILTLGDEEIEDFRKFSKDKRIHHGEAEGIAIAKNRGAVFLTNDSLVIKFCEEKKIKALSLKDVLILIANRGIIGEEEMRGLLREIEEGDNTFIREKEEILEEYGKGSKRPG
jgi:predicted nucleic acid-binding protein